MDYKVVIPKSFFSVFQFVQEGDLGVAAINTALRGFKHRLVFGWHFSIMLHFENVKKNGMPIDADHKRTEQFEDELADLLNHNLEKPNAIFLGRITWNSTAELIWRVHDADDANNIVQRVLSEKAYPFPFDYRIDPDVEWNLTEWHLKPREYEIDDN